MSNHILDERAAIKLLVSWLSQDHTYMPRFTPDKWWENDLCAVTKAGYWTEFEVKLSRQDFLKDKTKEIGRWEGTYPDMIKIVENKHDLLAMTERGPARFYYAVKEGVVMIEDIPAWAGLLEFQWIKYDENREDGYWQIKEMKKAPKRHRRKDHDMVNQLYRAAWYRSIGKLI